MKRHEDSKLLPYDSDDLFELVSDIESYPEFLPWCKAARIRKSETIENQLIMDADLVIAFAAFREKFGSHVVADRKAKTIHVDYLDGPFRNLEFDWKFVSEKRGTDVQFAVEFEFRSRILQTAIGQVFDLAMSRVMGAFESRAATLYTPLAFQS